MADPRQTQLLASLPTPLRQVTCSFDVTETVLTEPGFFLERKGAQMSPSSATGVIRLSSGAWVLKPVNDLSVAVHENEDAQNLVLRKSVWTTADHIAEVPYARRRSELPDLGYAAAVAVTGDHFMTKRTVAGTSWDRTVSDGLTAPSLPPTNVPLDLIAITNDSHDPDTGYLVKLIFPGVPLGNPDWMFSMEFGGSLITTTTAPKKDRGRFFWAVAGDGRSRVYEWRDGGWALIDEWRFETPANTTAAAIIARVIPHGSRFLEITTFAAGYAENFGMTRSVVRALLGTPAESGGTSVRLIEVEDRRRLGPADAGHVHPVSGRGQVRIRIRRDLSPRFQVARIGYSGTAGVITDRPFLLPYGVQSAHVVTFFANAWATFKGAPLVQVTAATGVIQEADGTALATASESYSFGGTSYSVSGFVPAGGTNACRAVITLTNTEANGDRWHTPVLFSYVVRRNEHTATHAPGVKTGGTLTGVSISGPGLSPEIDGAALVIDDLSNALSFLRARGAGTCRVETTYDGTPAKCILHDGYLGRVTSDRQGKEGATYPVPQYHVISVEAAGRWGPLRERFFESIIPFNDNTWAPDFVPGSTPGPWQATSIIRYCLQLAGVPNAQLDIPTINLPIFVGPNESAEAMAPEIGTRFGEYAQELARDYLGAILLHEPNAGANGMWRLLQPPTGTETPLWTFTTARPSGVKLAHLSASYGSQTSPILERLESTVIPPEANILTVVNYPAKQDSGVSSTIRQTLVNDFSFNSPRASIADPSDPDYLGRAVRIQYNLYGLPDQASVDFTARRLFQKVCRGIVRIQFVAECPLINAAALEPTIFTTRTHRPLRPFDQIWVNRGAGNERFVVESCNIIFEKAQVMLCHIEAQLYRPELVFQ